MSVYRIVRDPSVMTISNRTRETWESHACTSTPLQRVHVLGRWTLRHRWRCTCVQRCVRLEILRKHPQNDWTLDSSITDSDQLPCTGTHISAISIYNIYVDLWDLFLGTRTGQAPGAILVLLSKSESSPPESYAPEYIHNTVSCPAWLWPSLGMTHNVEKGSSVWENGSAAVPQLNRSSWDQNIVRNIWISLIVQYVGISHSISDYLRYGGLCGVGGAREGGIIFGLTRLPIRGFQTSMLILIPTHFYALSLAGWT